MRLVRRTDTPQNFMCLFIADFPPTSNVQTHKIRLYQKTDKQNKPDSRLQEQELDLSKRKHPECFAFIWHSGSFPKAIAF